MILYLLSKLTRVPYLEVHINDDSLPGCLQINPMIPYLSSISVGGGFLTWMPRLMMIPYLDVHM